MERYKTLFNLGEIYQINAKPPKDTGIKINGIKTFEKFEGKYYAKYETVLTPIVPAGEEFSHWVVNGEIVDNAELRINFAYVVDGEVDVPMN